MNAASELSPDEIAAFRAEGFVAIPCISPPAEVEMMRGVFDRLFENRAGWQEGKQFDLAGTDEAGRKAALPQLLNPSEFAPELRETQFRANALAIARQLLGPETVLWFEHAILKPAGFGAPTPWHQDEAHRNDAGTNYEQLSIWMPLQEVSAVNGCMKFIAGTHRGGVLEHRSPGNDPRVTALECIGPFEPARATQCPLPAGGATIHHCRTLHAADANTSAVPRRAYILAFRGPIRPDPSFTGYEWNAEKRTAADERRHAWENRYGAFGQAVAAMRGSLARVRGKVKRIVKG